VNRPVLFVTNHAPPFRVGAFAALHEREDVVFALIGGDVRHGGGAGARDTPFPVIRPSQRAVARLAGSGHYRAVIAGLSGKVALPAAYLGARRANVPFVLWATIWAHPRTPAHALSYLPTRHLYRHADAVVTYGRHVSEYVRAKGAATVFEAPQSVDDAFWSTPGSPRRHAPFQALFAGRMAREKGVPVLLRAWRSSGLSAPSAALVLVGGGPIRARAVATGAAVLADEADPETLRNFYAGSDVVVIPSIPTRDFREPWGLVANEAFNQGVPVIATDAVGAAAGGLIEHERTGLVVPAGDADALAGALRRLHDDPSLRARLGAAGREAVKAYSHAAWAGGMARALAAVGAGRPQDGC
jgi:glycosyltransferase involved in cell wall biosynthesis